MVLAIAHRGDPHEHRENTIPAVLAALEQGADLVEIDLRITRDGTAILLHDHTLTRLWNHDGAVAELSFDEICAACVGRYEIPTFDQVMAVSCAVSGGIMADLTVPAVAEAAAEIVAAHDGFEQTVFAGNLEGLLRVRQRWSHARIALSWNSGEPPATRLLDTLRPEFFNPNWYLLDQRLVDDMHERGYRVSTWTVDSPSNMARLVEMGVDAIITNRLRHFLAVREHAATSVRTEAVA
jgi:glycerophosphoryl diester phosphodiesterase